MFRRYLWLVAALTLVLALAGCGGGGEDEAVLPTPNAEGPAVLPTEGVAEPSGASPFEGEQVPGTPPQPGTTDDTEPTTIDVSTERVFGVDIPIPDGAIPIDTELLGPDAAKVTFEVPGMTGDDLQAYFAREMVAAGFELSPDEGGDEQNSVWTFSGNGVEGNLSIVDEAAEGTPGRFALEVPPSEQPE